MRAGTKESCGSILDEGGHIVIKDKTYFFKGVEMLLSKFICFTEPGRKSHKMSYFP